MMRYQAKVEGIEAQAVFSDEIPDALKSVESPDVADFMDVRLRGRHISL